MKFEFKPEDEAFRVEVREFIRDNLPKELAQESFRLTQCVSKEAFVRWQKILDQRGWAATHWPVEFGGTGWTAVQQHIYMEEVYRADAIDSGWQGMHMAAPVIIAFGSDEQKQRYLEPMRKGEEYWCQGFSEPNAGSDLANLKTTAILDGDHYMVNGQKIWTSRAHESDFCVLLARTDPAAERPQKGISFLLLDMKTPGVTVRPIAQYDGNQELNEVFFDSVKVPKENLIGEPNKGWTYAKYLLEKERTTSAFLYFNKKQLDNVKLIARHEKHRGEILLNTEAFQRRLARVEMDLYALEWSVLRILAEEKTEINLDAVVSTLKIRGALMQQRIGELQMDALGLRSLRFFDLTDARNPLPDSSEFWPDYIPGRTAQCLFNRAATVYGGSREVQKNIIAKLAFGL